MSRELIREAIGNSSNGIDGTDYFYKIMSADNEPISYEDVRAELENEGVFYDTNQEAGGQFCRTFSFYPHQYNANMAIISIEVRYDV